MIDSISENVVDIESPDCVGCYVKDMTRMLDLVVVRKIVEF